MRALILLVVLVAAGLGGLALFEKNAAREGTPETPATATPAADTALGDWPMFRGDPTLAGRVTLTRALDKPLRVWTYRAGDAIESSAAIVDGVVFIGSMDGVLHAIGLDDGKPRWTMKLGAGITATPLVLGDAVLLGDGLGVFRALSRKDGTELWKYDAQTEIHSSANTDGTRVLFGAYDDQLHCLDARTGKRLWTFLTEGQLHSTPAVIDGKTFISGCDETFRVIDVATGKEESSLEMGGYTAASPAARGDRVFVGTFSCQVLGIDWRRGRKIWTFENPDRQFPYYATCAVTEGRVVAAGRDKTVYCLDADTGKELWRFRSRARFDSSPVIAGKSVFIGGGDGNLYRLDLEEGGRGGEGVWSFPLGAPVIGSPSIGGGRLVIADGDGVVHCFQVAATGNPGILQKEPKR